ncbi:MAG TPA: 50S ribosomal protein L4 [Candidatus Bipolaricaulota bacterium]|nr:50S ribosomal protein L4 [Candidatus Bipolaricaulota bacterium]
MLKAKVYNKAGQEVKTIDLPKSIFGIEPKTEVINQALVAQRCNGRQVLAHAKTKAEVRGGGRKPWKQKGTGRARHGSNRSPIWIGGGVTFGPSRDRNFEKKINKKVRRKAIAMVLTDRFESGVMKLVDRLDFEAAKTKQAAEVMKNLELSKSVLVVIEKTDQLVIRAFHNIPKTLVVRADSLNVYDLLKYKNLLMTADSVSAIVETFVKETKADVDNNSDK